MPGDLDPLIHQRTRLQILAALHRNREASFTDLRDGLDLTPGNLKSHAAKLEAAGYIDERRVLVGTSFEMRYRITEEGSAAFETYLAQLRGVLEGAGDQVPSPEAPDAEGRPTGSGPGPML